MNGIFVDQYNQLIIPSFDARHAGHYSCVVFFENTECMRSEATISEFLFLSNIVPDKIDCLRMIRYQIGLSILKVKFIVHTKRGELNELSHFYLLHTSAFEGTKGEPP